VLKFPPMGNQTFKNYKDISSRSSLHARSNTPAQLSALSVRPHAVRLRAAVPGSSPTHSPLPPCPFLPVSVKKKNIYIPIKLFIISCETCFHVTGAKMGFHVGNSMLLTAPGTSAKNPQPTPSVSVAAACPLPPSPPPPLPRREHTLPVLEKFDGDITKSRGFLMQCSLIFRQQIQAYGSDYAKITLMVELMTGRVLQWAQAVLNLQPNISYKDFLSKFRCVFDKGTDADGAANHLFTLKQGRKSVTDFSIDFWILAEETGWVENALRGAFLNCLNEGIKHELATKELPKSLSALINMCIQLDNHMREFGRRAGEGRRLGHWVDTCPKRVKDSAPNSVPHLSCPAKLIFHSLTHPCSALIDSGAEQSFLDESLAHKLAIPIVPLPEPLWVSALDGSPLTTVTHRTRTITLTLSGNHSEHLSLFLFKSPDAPLVLGYPWLQQHNPQIDWAAGRISGWSGQCHALCLRSATFSATVAGSAEPVAPPDLSGVPPEYHDLAQVFCKDKASSLPPHRPYDCGIDLFPDSMEWYINDSLAAGIIRPSTSPLGAGFFFVAKKDRFLQPCIDFRGLNKITIKNKYPLPLLASAFELLQGATVFSKLDLCNAYHLVRIREGDEWKTAFNTHLGHFEYLVMPFGLTNAPAVFQAMINDVLRDLINHCVFVYLDDILVFSRSPAEHVEHVRLVLQCLLENHLFVKAEKCEFHVPTVSFLGFMVEQGWLRADPAKVKAVVEWPEPKTRRELQKFLGFANFYRCFIRNFSRIALPLTNLTSPKLLFQWSLDAQRAFAQLKALFSSAPVLVQADLELPFFVEVDASDSGVGAVLSQQVPGKMHPCAFFSRRLSPAKRNYDDLPILPPSCFVGALTWEIERVVRDAQRQEPDPGMGPEGKLFVPASARSKVLQWTHTARFACHPGKNHTVSFLRRLFWWPTLLQDAGEYVVACPVCAKNKMPTSLPAGLLRPLPVPMRPWSHVALDFVTGLPPSSGNTAVLTIVDRFSKAAHFIALPQLPSALETARLLTQHVFRLHGIPRDIVSDRGPQFTSRVWREFCVELGAQVSLSSGFHPQTNGQTERANQALEAMLRCVISSNQSTWSKQLTWVEYAYNSSTSAATGVSPFEASLGYQPPLLSISEEELAVPSVQLHMRCCRRAWRAARAAFLRTAAQNKRLADRRCAPAPDYQVGQQVWFSTKHVSLRTESKKLAPRFIGPFPVQAVLNPVTVRLSLPRNMRTHNIFSCLTGEACSDQPAVPASQGPATRPDYRRRPGVLHHPHYGCPAPR
uniref:Gypsy retrotransposon integrase-like protein 1 n=1 Tax=Pundamilia nyererei TaxID=303518 RepID=A0A3B4GQD0_9CICH